MYMYIYIPVHISLGKPNWALIKVCKHCNEDKLSSYTSPFLPIDTCANAMMRLFRIAKEQTRGLGPEQVGSVAVG